MKDVSVRIKNGGLTKEIWRKPKEYQYNMH